MKPIINIFGTLGYKPEKGYRAYIQPDEGKPLFTSQIVDVRNDNNEGVEIETENTIYKITYSKNELPLAG